MNTWWQISWVYEHVLSWVLIQIHNGLWGQVYNLHCGQLILETIVIQYFIPSFKLINDIHFFKLGDIVNLDRSYQTFFYRFWLRLCFQKDGWVRAKKSSEDICSKHSKFTVKRKPLVRKLVLITIYNRSPNLGHWNVFINWISIILLLEFPNEWFICNFN